MSTLQFDRGPLKLSLILQDGSTLARFDAANNVDSHSKGIWPDGRYQFSFHNAHPGDLPNSAFGSHGIFVFEVPNREGMGVHSGREGVPDGLGKEGFEHCTMGCIRTTDETMAQLVRTHAVDPIVSITVSE